MAVKPRFMPPKRAKKAITAIGKHFADERTDDPDFLYMDAVDMENYAQIIAADWRCNPFEPTDPAFKPFAEMLGASFPYQHDRAAIVMYSREIAVEIYDRLLALQIKTADSIQEDLVLERLKEEEQYGN